MQTWCMLYECQWNTFNSDEFREYRKSPWREHKHSGWLEMVSSIQLNTTSCLHWCISNAHLIDTVSHTSEHLRDQVSSEISHDIFFCISCSCNLLTRYTRWVTQCFYLLKPNFCKYVKICECMAWKTSQWNMHTVTVNICFCTVNSSKKVLL